MTVSGAEKWRQANHPAVLEVATRAATPVRCGVFACGIRSLELLAGAAEGRCVPPSRSADKSSSSWCENSVVGAGQPAHQIGCVQAAETQGWLYRFDQHR